MHVRYTETINSIVPIVSVNFILICSLPIYLNNNPPLNIGHTEIGKFPHFNDSLHISKLESALSPNILNI